MKRVLIIVLLLLLIGNFSYRIDLRKSPHELIGELMYFPSGTAIRALSMGFYAPLADLIWLRFVQYYGEHRLTDAKFELMYHILDVLTTLDQKFLYAYTLGGLMLTTESNNPEQARKLLHKGIHANTDDWRIPFVYGFIHYVFLHKYHIAEAYFRLSAQKPNAPDIPQRWAAYVLYTKLGDLRTSLGLWIDLYMSTENPEEKAIAEIYIRDIKMELDIEFLNAKIEEFIEKTGQIPYTFRTLIAYGLLDSIPAEPHNEDYIIREGKAYSTWQFKFKR
ncbi:MAG: hypothetical protein JSV97_08165 [candidate division WOR-3 bacterium]|nr:MAG: hypothetical protein JSV97_08165 [candidate division WOR-3 bacterium]